MNTPQRFPVKLITLFVVGLVLTLAVIMLTPSPAPAEPKISWLPESVTQTLLAGENITVSVSFTASENLNNASVRVVPELAPYVQTNPTSFASIAKGQTVNLDIMISAPADSLPKVVDGTIQLRSDQGAPKTFAKPLPIVLTITEASKIISAKGLELAVPTGWTLDQGSLDLGGPISLNNFGGAFRQGGLRPPGGAETDVTTVQRPTLTLQEVIDRDLKGTTIESTTGVSVDGQAGTKVMYSFDTLTGGVEKNVAVYVFHGDLLYKFFLSYTDGDPKENQFLSTFDDLLASVRFTE